MAKFERVLIPGTGKLTTYATRNRPVEVGDGLMGLGSIDDRWHCVKAASGFSVQRDNIFGGYAVCEQLYVKSLFDDSKAALREWRRLIKNYRAEQERRLSEAKR